MAIQVTLTDRQERLIRRRIESGMLSTPEEVVEVALKMLEVESEENGGKELDSFIEREALKALESPQGRTLDWNRVWAEVDRRLSSGKSQ